MKHFQISFTVLEAFNGFLYFVVVVSVIIMASQTFFIVLSLVIRLFLASSTYLRPPELFEYLFSS